MMLISKNLELLRTNNVEINKIIHLLNTEKATSPDRISAKTIKMSIDIKMTNNYLTNI